MNELEYLEDKMFVARISLNVISSYYFDEPNQENYDTYENCLDRYIVAWDSLQECKLRQN